MLKKLFFYICIVLSCFTLRAITSDSLVTVHFIDIGQGDCTFIDYGEIEIIIDAGNNQYGDDVCEYIEEMVDGQLEIMIATHPDADHIGGLDIVLNNFDVQYVIDSGKKHTTKTYKDYINAVKNEENVQFMYDEDMIFELGEGITFKIIETIDNHSDNNQNSVVCQLDVLNTSFLFMADAEIEIEHEFIDKFEQIDVLKAGHHGSRTSSSNYFLNTVDPSYAIISCGFENRYGHPHKEVLDRFNENNIFVYRTDLQGTIIATTNGTDISFNIAPFVE